MKKQDKRTILIVCVLSLFLGGTMCSAAPAPCPQAREETSTYTLTAKIDTALPFFLANKTIPSSAADGTYAQIVADPFPDVLTLQNKEDGSPIVLQRYNKHGGPDDGAARRNLQYRLVINGRPLEKSKFWFFEDTKAFAIMDMFVGMAGDYRHTGNGIGTTIFKYLFAYAAYTGKTVALTKIKSYYAVRSMYAAAPAVRFTILQFNGRCYERTYTNVLFGQIDWLRDLGTLVMEVSGKDGLWWRGRFVLPAGSQTFEYINGSGENAAKEKDDAFAQLITLRESDNHVLVRWNNPPAVPDPLSVQVYFYDVEITAWAGTGTAESPAPLRFPAVIEESLYAA